MRLALCPIIVLALFAAGSSPLTGQSDDAPLPSTSETEQRIRVRLVQVPILARDRNGKAVTDLTAADMRVKVQGDRMDIAFLDPIVDEAKEVELPRTRLKLNAPGGAVGDPSPQSGASRYYVIFVDVENDYKLKRVEAMEDTFRFVEQHLSPTDRFAVISYDGEIRLEAPFTSDLGSIRAGVENAYTRGTGKYMNVTRRILDLVDEMKLCQTDAGAYVGTYDELCIKDSAYDYAARVRPRAEGFVKALDSVVTYLGGLEGRKTVLALSHGFAVEPASDILGAARAIYGNSPELGQWLMTLTLGEGARNDLDRLIAAAVDSRVTLHFVDRNPVPSVDHSARSSAAFQPGGDRPVAGAHAAAQADIEEVAGSTGGVLIKTIDVYQGLSKTMALERGAYMLGYYIDRYVKPEKLRRVSISTERKGVKISHQRGVYSSVGKSVEEAGDGSVVGKFVFGQPRALEEDEAKGRFIPFHILAEPRGIGYELNDDEAYSTFSLHLQLLQADGQELQDSYHLVNHSYPRSVWEENDIGPVVLDGWLEVPPGDYLLRAYIRNSERKTQGRFEQVFRVPGA